MADLLVTQLRQLLQIDTSRIHSRIFPKNYEDVIQVISKHFSFHNAVLHLFKLFIFLNRFCNKLVATKHQSRLLEEPAKCLFPLMMSSLISDISIGFWALMWASKRKIIDNSNQHPNQVY